MNRTRIQLRSESRSADTSPSRLSRDAQNYSRPCGSPLLRRQKDDIILNKNYGLFSPQSKVEAAESLARVMEIQRQASMMPHYPSLVWLDQFVQTRALEENTRYQKVPERSAPFENLYHDLANTAVKNNERCQPLRCPNFPRLPQKKSKHRASNMRISRSNDTSPTRNQEEYGNPSNNVHFQQFVNVQMARPVPNISLTKVDPKSPKTPCPEITKLPATSPANSDLLNTAITCNSLYSGPTLGMRLQLAHQNDHNSQAKSGVNAPIQNSASKPSLGNCRQSLLQVKMLIL